MTEAVPAVAMSLAETTAVSCLGLLYVVNALPFHSTTELLMKFLPFTVSVKDVLPTIAEGGSRDVSVGVEAAAALTVNDSPFDVPPPGVGLKTVTVEVPGSEISDAGTVAVNSVELTTVASAVPFHCTAEPFTKLVPVTISVNAAPPAVAELGASGDVSMGTGLFTASVTDPVAVV